MNEQPNTSPDTALDAAAPFVLDMLTKLSSTDVLKVQEELWAMRTTVKTHMDQGLGSEEMECARTVETGIAAAEDVVRQLFT